MPRKSRATGVGRGNGLGSKRSQFKPDQPPPRGSGRPRKKPVPPSSSISEAWQRVLHEQVSVTIDGKRVKIPRIELWTKLLAAEFPDASVKDKLAILRDLKGLGVALEPRTHVPSAETIHDVLAQLAEEADREARLDEQYPR